MGLEVELSDLTPVDPAEEKRKKTQRQQTFQHRAASFRDLVRQEEITRQEEDPNAYDDPFWESTIFIILMAIMQGIVIIVIGAWGKYPSKEELQSEIELYPFFRDVNIMIFFGFGFLMTFLRRFGYSAIGFTFFTAALVSQYSMVVRGIVLGWYTLGDSDEFPRFAVSLHALIDGLFCSGAVLISLGAVLGKVLIMCIIEPWFFFANVIVLNYQLEIHDVGGGMTIHVLGAFYGVIATIFMTQSKHSDHPDNTSKYSADIFSLGGTLFLWLLWPSFNAAIAVDTEGRVLAAINTFLSICASTIAAFIFSRLLMKHNFDVQHIQNSTLAGGVVMGVAADFHLTGAGAMACGFVAGGISVIGYKWITPFLAVNLHLQDSCGVLSLHGIPGVLSAIVGVLSTIKGAQSDSFGFPRGQPALQLAGLGITLGFAICGGLLTGILFKILDYVRPLPRSLCYNDRAFWVVPTDYFAVVSNQKGFSLRKEEEN